MGTLRPKYLLYGYMEPLGRVSGYRHSHCKSLGVMFLSSPGSNLRRRSGGRPSLGFYGLGFGVIFRYSSS